MQTCTPWKAPIIWEGMFDPNLYDRAHQKGGTSVALTVFAVGRLVRDSRGSSDSFSISFSSVKSALSWQLLLGKNPHLWLMIANFMPPLLILPQLMSKRLWINTNYTMISVQKPISVCHS